MRTSALAAATLGLATVLSGVVLATPALADPDPAAPVVVNDSVAMYPQGVASVDVLANDTDPGDPDGSDLRVCRLPLYDLDTIATDPPPLIVSEGNGLIGESGDLTAMLFQRRLASPYVVNYYVCNLTNLTPATLTVTTLSVAPVSVTKVDGRPGWVKVVNHNTQRVNFTWMSSSDEGASISQRAVGAQGSRLVHVNLRRFTWFAAIGTPKNNGIADDGRIVDKRVPTKTKHHKSAHRMPAYVRELAKRLY